MYIYHIYLYIYKYICMYIFIHIYLLIYIEMFLDVSHSFLPKSNVQNSITQTNSNKHYN